MYFNSPFSLWFGSESDTLKVKPFYGALWKKHIKQKTKFNKSIYYMAELVHGEKERSDWFLERSEFCYTDR